MIRGLLLPNIALVGFMGAGKSSVGRVLARRTGLLFCDLDTEIEREVGLAIPEIFARHGEPFFREQERSALAALCSGSQRVIACGGGTLLDPRNREIVRERCVSVWLRASTEELLRRVTARPLPARPLLQGAEPGQIIPELLRAREATYQGADLTVLTDGLDVFEVAEEIRRLLGLPCAEGV